MTYETLLLRRPRAASVWAIRRISDGQFYLRGFATQDAAMAATPTLHGASRWWTRDPLLVSLDLASQLRLSTKAHST